MLTLLNNESREANSIDTDQTAGVRGTFLNSKDIFQIHDRLTFKVLSVKFMFMYILII